VFRSFRKEKDLCEASHREKGRVLPSWVPLIAPVERCPMLARNVRQVNCSRNNCFCIVAIASHMFRYTERKNRRDRCTGGFEVMTSFSYRPTELLLSGYSAQLNNDLPFLYEACGETSLTRPRQAFRPEQTSFEKSLDHGRKACVPDIQLESEGEWFSDRLESRIEFGPTR
jgi:hypothetical protein